MLMLEAGGKLCNYQAVLKRKENKLLLPSEK